MFQVTSIIWVYETTVIVMQWSAMGHSPWENLQQDLLFEFCRELNHLYQSNWQHTRNSWFRSKVTRLTITYLTSFALWNLRQPNQFVIDSTISNLNYQLWFNYLITFPNKTFAKCLFQLLPTLYFFTLSNNSTTFIAQNFVLIFL